MQGYKANITIYFSDVETEADACDKLSAIFSENLQHSGIIDDWHYTMDKSGRYPPPAVCTYSEETERSAVVNPSRA